MKDKILTLSNIEIGQIAKDEKGEIFKVIKIETNNTFVVEYLNEKTLEKKHLYTHIITLEHGYKYILMKKVVICLHCKEFHLEGIEVCNFCNTKSFQETDYRNKKFIKN